MTSRKRLAVDAASEGARLDAFLAARLPAFSRSRLHALIEGGLVRVSGETRKPSSRVHRGEEVTVEIPDAPASTVIPQVMDLDIRYEDDDVLVVNKPVGLPVHPGPGHAAGTLVNALLARLPALAGVGGGVRPGIVHRLDKDTSGLLVVAKTETALRALQAAIRAREVRREYLAVVQGRLAVAEGVVDAPIARHPRHRRRMAVVAGGRRAVTRYRLREQFATAALVEASLHTGRTHQIRVHFAYLGHPLVGDRTYGGRGETWGMTRQALHAFRLTVPRPGGGAPIVIEAPLPDDMAQALAALRRGDSCCTTQGVG